MATTDCTLGTRFAGRQFLEKTDTFHFTAPFLARSSPFFDDTLLDNALAELMETLRLRVDDLLRMNIPVQTRRRLILRYCEIEEQVKALRMMFFSEFGRDV